MVTSPEPVLADRPTLLADETWWRHASIYEVYPRSFRDGNGDGLGDLAGLRDGLRYLVDLGVDALWITPWYCSPMADGGYDVADYRAIDARFGDLAEAEQLVSEALSLGLRTIIDIVPNHVSSQHLWFTEALHAGPGSPERRRFWFRTGRGDDGELPPNDWVSEFGGPAWSRAVDASGRPEQWYLHLFSPDQPDLNWHHPEVRREHEDVLRFWFERGVSGVRIDSAALLAKDELLPDVPGDASRHPYVDRDEVVDIYRSWRQVAEEYGRDRALIGEVWLPDMERFARYLRPGVLHAAFNFDFMTAPWDAAELRASVDRTLAAHAKVSAPPSWVLSNHDVTRPVTRYGRADTRFAFDTKRVDTPTDLDLGRRRARAAALLAMALPGAFYLYQGDELGLPEVSLDAEHIQDPMHARSGGVDPGRDGCRVPLPWSGSEPPFGFSSPYVDTWLPQPDDWHALTAESQSSDPDSMLSLYRTALRTRRTHPDLRDWSVDWPLAWLDTDDEVLAFRRGKSFACVTNLSTVPVALPAGARVRLCSAELDHGDLPPDATAWVDLPPLIRAGGTLTPPEGAR